MRQRYRTHCVSSDRCQTLPPQKNNRKDKTNYKFGLNRKMWRLIKVYLMVVLLVAAMYYKYNQKVIFIYILLNRYSTIIIFFGTTITKN